MIQATTTGTPTMTLILLGSPKLTSILAYFKLQSIVRKSVVVAAATTLLGLTPGQGIFQPLFCHINFITTHDRKLRNISNS